MLHTLAVTWSLLLGIGLLMLGNGLQGTLLGVRAVIEEFPTTAIGVVMSIYYIGFMLGSVVTPRLVKRVGHIRVFAAMASLASVVVLQHAIFVSPLTWGSMRLLSGFCFAGLYVVAESWLNGMSANTSRGQLLSAYMLVVWGGFAGGQFLLNLADPASFELFTLISVLVSVALVPMLLTDRPGPAHHESVSLGLRALFRIAPLAVLSALLVGVAHGALWGMGAVYAAGVGLSVRQVSVFMGVLILGGLVLQWPVGHLSDRVERRHVLAATSALAAVSALGVAGAARLSPQVSLLAIAVFGALSLPLYSVTLAYANDYLEPRQMVAASGTLVMLNGAGSALGPVTAAGMMTVFGTDGFPLTLATAHVLVTLYALWLIGRVARIRPERQKPFVTAPLRGTAVGTAITQRTVRDHMDRDIARMSRMSR